MAAVKALQQWCRIQCEGYRDVAITNMTTSFRDGLAFCALIHKHRADLIDFDSLSKENVYDNNRLAFRVAEDELGIPALLDAEDMVALKVPDRLSILTYVSQYYNYFHGRSPIGGMAGIKRPAEEPIDHVSGVKNQPVDRVSGMKNQPADHVSGKKNQPVTAKVFGLPKANTETKSEVLTELSNKQGSLSSNCNVCHQHVHLVQRHLVDGKLYHRNCFKCTECSNILLSGTYKPGKEPNTFICKSHQITQKPPTTKTTQITILPQNTKAAPITTIFSPSSTKSHVTTGKESNLKESAPSNISSRWLVGKDERKHESSSTPTPAPRSKPASSRSEVVEVKRPEQKVQVESHKGPSTSVLRNQEARQRFFESSSSPANSPSSTNNDVVSSANEKSATKSVASNGKVPLRTGNWSNEKNKEKENNEKEKAKVIISKMVNVETSKSSSPTERFGGIKTNVSSTVVPADTVVKGRVRLRAQGIDVNLNTTPTSTKTSSWQTTKDKSSPSVLDVGNKDTEAPSDWRSLLKPVAKDPKSGGSKNSTVASTNHKTPDTPSRPMDSHPTSSPSSISTASLFVSSSSRLHSTSSLEDSSMSCIKDLERPKNLNMSSSTSASSSAATPQKLSKLKPDYIPREEIVKELRDIERNLNDLEKKGVELEKQLRQCEEDGEEDLLTNDLMVDWFNLIRSKQVYIRRESELVYVGRAQDLEEEQPNVDAELRKLMEKPEHLKTFHDRQREKELMEKLVEIVNDRNAIVDGLDEDRLREEEEDEQLNRMMQNLDLKKEKKKKSPISKFFSWKTKQESVET